MHQKSQSELQFGTEGVQSNQAAQVASK